ncbi:LysR family transcriptional regulator [Pelagibius marinus]|uniref:LysR family transcriptional regulator n=1 Tax=Pelagibius marinus TaxID=2762760 RepID=UPI00187309DE|nr:LysR family transcriptional regulator [Pelagibius marinus]
MQIELLDTFLDLIETNSFNRTAERLGLTQSTVSSRVKSLETALGKRLFTRSRAGTQPTAAGQRLVDHARAMRREWNEARRAVKRSGDFAQLLRIGIQNDLAASHIGDWVSEFRKALPETSFYIELDYSIQMSADVLAGELDLAVLFTPRHLPDLHYESVGEIAYRMVSTQAARLAEVDRERYIFANYSPAFDRAHRQVVQDFPDAPVASGQSAAVCGLLSALGGSAFVLEESARDLVAAGTCRYVEDVAPIPQTVYLATHLRHRHVHRRLLAIVRRYFARAG